MNFKNLSFEDFSQSAPQLIVLLNDSFCCMDANPAAQAYFGMHSKNDISWEFRSLLSASHQQKIQLFAQTDNEQQLLIPVLELPNRTSMLKATLTKITHENKFSYLLVAEPLADKIENPLLRHSEDSLQMAIAAGQMGLWLWDLETRKVETYGSCRAMFDIPADQEIFYDMWLQTIHTEDRQIVHEAISNALQYQSVFRTEFRILWLGGYVHWIVAQGRGIYDDKGNVIQMVLTTQDITQFKKAEEALEQAKEQKALLAELINRSSQPMGIGAKDGSIILLNPAYLRLTGYDESDMRKLSWVHDLTPPEWRNYEMQIVEEVLQTGQPRRYEKEYVKKDGSRIPVELLLQLIPHENGDGETWFYCIATDITERKRYEAQLLDINSKLDQEVKLRTNQLEHTITELESFSYSVSHDLRSPLRAINGWSMALLEDYSDVLDDNAKEYIQKLLSESNRMGTIIDAQLKLSQVVRTKPQFQMLNISQMAKSIIHRIINSQPDRLFQIDIPDEIWVYGDYNSMEIVLSNLLENACKFTRTRTPARICFGEMEKKKERVFFVSDNGVGFKMEYAKKLFLPFQRLHKVSEFPGTGIGLATVQRVIHRFGGKIWGEALVEQGATFYFTLGDKRPKDEGGEE